MSPQPSSDKEDLTGAIQMNAFPPNKFVDPKKTLSSTLTGLSLHVSKAPPGRLVISKNEVQKFVYSQPTYSGTFSTNKKHISQEEIYIDSQ